jgi:hypothetical protein
MAWLESIYKEGALSGTAFALIPLRIETLTPSVGGFVRSNIKGASLIELLVAVILISTIATAFLNLRNNRGILIDNESELSVFDSACYAVLDEIGLELQMANRKRDGKAMPFKHLKAAHKITINAENGQIQYQFDDCGRLIRRTGHGSRIMADNALYLKIRELGRETVVLTLIARPTGDDAGGLGHAVRSYSRVVTVNFPLE